MGTEGKRIPALDGLRGVAVLMVIVFHYYQDAAADPAAGLVRLMAIGRSGVDLFFVLSGFLITEILLRTRGTALFFRNFYMRRSLRILPLYFAFLSVSLFLPPVFRPAWPHFLFLQDIFLTFAGVCGGVVTTHLWSLAVEEHFYLFWPFLVAVLSRASLLRAIAFMVAAGFCLRLFMISAQIDVTYFTLTRFDSIAAGSALAIFYTAMDFKRWRRRLYFWLLIGSAPLLFWGFLRPAGSAQLLALRAFKDCSTACIFLIVVVASLSGGWFARIMEARALREIGRLSYAMYVVHQIAVRVVQRGIGVHYWGIPLVLLAAYLAARVSWRFIEAPFLALKRKFEYAPREPMPTLTF